MKLLKGQIQSIDSNGIKFDLKVIDTATQAGLLDKWDSFIKSKGGLRELVDAVSYCVNECIEGDVFVNDSKVSRDDILCRVDINSAENQNVFLEIVKATIQACSLSDEEVKK